MYYVHIGPSCTLISDFVVELQEPRWSFVISKTPFCIFNCAPPFTPHPLITPSRNSGPCDASGGQCRLWVRDRWFRPLLTTSRERVHVSLPLPVLLVPGQEGRRNWYLGHIMLLASAAEISNWIIHNHGVLIWPWCSLVPARHAQSISQLVTTAYTSA